MIYSDVNDIAIFINKVIIWWKILNAKAIGADTRHNDPLQAVINNPDDNRLNLILQFGDMALKMAGPKGKCIKHLSKDTATCIHQTCYGLVDLCRYFLTLRKTMYFLVNLHQITWKKNIVYFVKVYNKYSILFYKRFAKVSYSSFFFCFFFQILLTILIKVYLIFFVWFNNISTQYINI